VFDRIKSVAYHLALPPQVRSHNVIHVVFLKKFASVPLAVPVQLPPIKHDRVLPLPEHDLRARPNRGTWEIWVK
jgi:hypothetical protein